MVADRGVQLEFHERENLVPHDAEHEVLLTITT